MKYLEAAALGDGAVMFEGFLHEVLIGQVSVGDEPEISCGAQGLCGHGDEFEAEHGVGFASVMEGRVHDDVVIGGGADALGDVFPEDAWAHGDGDESGVAAGTFEGAGIGFIHV